MTRTDLYQTIILIITFLGAFPGIYSFLVLRKNSKPKISCDIQWPMNTTTYPTVLFVILTFKPGVKAIQISSIESTGSGLAVTKNLSPSPKNPMECDPTIQTGTDPLQPLWRIPSSHESQECLSAILLLSSANRDILSSVNLSIRWKSDSSRRLTYTHKNTMEIKLMTTNRKRINPAHYETVI